MRKRREECSASGGKEFTADSWIWRAEGGNLPDVAGVRQGLVRFNPMYVDGPLEEYPSAFQVDGELVFVNIILFPRYEGEGDYHTHSWRRLSSSPEIPRLLSLVLMSRCHTLSKAPMMSRPTMKVSSPRSRDSILLSGGEGLLRISPVWSQIVGS